MSSTSSRLAEFLNSKALATFVFEFQTECVLG